MTPMPLLAIRDLHVRLGHRQIIQGLSMDVSPGELIGLIGPNGAGKSTLLRSLAGLIPVRGEITLSGRSGASLTLAERAMLLAYVPQEHEIAWPISVERLVGLGRVPYTGTFALRRGKDDRKAVRQAMESMDVTQFAARSAMALSGGEKARVLIARALAQQTPILIADEPAGGLDPAHQIALMRILRALADEGRAVIATLHDLALASRWCTRLVVLNHGAIVADGRPEEVLTDQLLADVYGVRAYLGTAAGGPVVQCLDLSDPERQEP